MAYPRLGTAGMDFTVTKWNAMIDALEAISIKVLGPGILSGCDIAIVSGLKISISNGFINSRSCVEITQVPDFTCPANTTTYLWINEDGTVTGSSTSTNPGGNNTGLGAVVTNGTSITSILSATREEISLRLQEVAQAGGYKALDLSSSSIVLTREQYKCRIIEFTGVLTANRTVTIPNKAGYMWNFVNSTTGSFTVTIVPETGTSQVIDQGTVTTAWSDGTGLRVANSVQENV